MARNDKRDRLVAAADKLIYEQTFHITTLADIAKEADVPLGNVYYYFKTKEAILDAVLQKRLTAWRELFHQWEALPSTQDRLKAFIQYSANQCETLSKFGCVIGSLCQELGKQSEQIAEGSTSLLREILNWTKAQFKALGKEEADSNQLAEHLIASLQGISLLTLTFKSPDLIKRQSATLENWVGSL